MQSGYFSQWNEYVRRRITSMTAAVRHVDYVEREPRFCLCILVPVSDQATGGRDCRHVVGSVLGMLRVLARGRLVKIQHVAWDSQHLGRDLPCFP